MKTLLHYAQIAYHWKLGHRTDLPYVPEDISVEVTNTCNFRCRFCSQSDPNHFQKVVRSALNTEKCAVLLNKLRSGGVSTSVIHWTLDGEPFTNPEFAEICRTGQRFGFNRAIFSSNGMLATRKRLKELPVGADSSYEICVDFAPDAEYSERIRGTPGSWKRVLENVREALAAGDLKHIRFRLTDISGYESRMSPSNHRVDGQKASRIQELFSASPRISFRTRTFHNATGFLPTEIERIGRYHVCPYPWTSMVIASNGDVVACCRDLEHKTILGNLFSQSFNEIWNGAEAKKLRTALVRQDLQGINACKDCDLPWDRSKHGILNLISTASNRLGLASRSLMTR